MATSWIQLALTIGAFVIAMVVFYFKNEALLRSEIQGSEERLRTKIDGVRDQVHGIETKLAVLEDRHERPRPQPVATPAPAE